MIKRFQPRLELLEDRLVPAASFLWQQADRLTLSFADDGVAILDTTNQLHQSLRHLSSQDWQTQILRAFQSWAAVTNINYALVADGGQPFGTSGLPQGDRRFGDVRIGAFSQSEDALAIASPADLFAGTWAGDIFLNSNIHFTLDGQAGPDLYSAMLHEIGHVLGLEHSDDPLSVMQSDLLFVTALPTVDIERIQILYGIRQPDEFEHATGNETIATASALHSPTDKSATFGAIGDITTGADIDVYSFRTQGNTQTVSISLQTNGVSLLLPRLTVHNADGEIMSSLLKVDHFSGDLELQFASGKPDIYYVKVESDDADFDIGSYRLQVNLLTNSPQPREKEEDKEKTPNSLQDKAIFLKPYHGDPSDISYKVNGILGDSEGAVYGFKVPNADKLGDKTTMLLTVRQTGSEDWQPELQIFDRFGEPVDFETLIDGERMVTIQLRDATPNQDYFVQIDGDTVDDSEFFLGIDFSADPVELEVFASGVSGTTDSVEVLEIDRNRLVHFLGHGQDDAHRTGVVQLVIEDNKGAVVAELATTIGEYSSATIFLPKGTYFLRVSTLGEGDQQLAGVAYVIAGKRLSDPVGPELQDLLIDPVFPRPTDNRVPGGTQTASSRTLSSVTETAVIGNVARVVGSTSRTSLTVEDRSVIVPAIIAGTGAVGFGGQVNSTFMILSAPSIIVTLAPAPATQAGGSPALLPSMPGPIESTARVNDNFGDANMLPNAEEQATEVVQSCDISEPKSQDAAESTIERAGLRPRNNFILTVLLMSALSLAGHFLYSVRMKLHSNRN